MTKQTKRLEKLVGDSEIVIRRARVKVTASKHNKDIRICFRWEINATSAIKVIIAIIGIIFDHHIQVTKFL